MWIALKLATCHPLDGTFHVADPEPSSPLLIVTVSVLPLVAGQERQIRRLIQIAHMGHGNADVRRQLGMNLAIGGVVLIAPPANAHQHIVAISRVRQGDALSFGGQQAQA